MLHAASMTTRQFHLVVGYVFNVQESLGSTAVVDTDSIVALMNQLPSLLRRFPTRALLVNSSDDDHRKRTLLPKCPRNLYSQVSI
ncbi:hypothetical protein CGRA01v4_08535 [Colletotrichum graminicola]|nr:hypothetical protein CGRA01v4_08535 [Colletotrichum graminicola]